MKKKFTHIDPAALDFRQGVKGVPEPDKPLLEFQDFLEMESGLVQVGGVFDLVLAV